MNNKFLNFIAKNSPTILTGIGVGGTIATAIFASQATLKAEKILEEHKEAESVKDKAVLVLPTYIPTILMGATTITCIIMSNVLNKKHMAILGSAYALSVETLREYQKNVVEEIGEKKEKKIRDKVAIEKMQSNKSKPLDVFNTGHGTSLCYDSFSGRYFLSDIESIRQGVNNLNAKMINQDYISLNEFYEEIGLHTVRLGYELGWNMSTEGLISIDYSSGLSPWGEPCLVMDYLVVPRYDYSSYS